MQGKLLLYKREKVIKKTWHNMAGLVLERNRLLWCNNLNSFFIYISITHVLNLSNFIKSNCKKRFVSIYNYKIILYENKIIS